MDFLDLMNTLFELQAKFPDLSWHISDTGFTECMNIQFAISPENAKLLRDAGSLFA